MKQIILTFEDDGKTVHKEVSGFSGKGCASATEFIEKALGKTKETKISPEYYIPTPVGIDQQAKCYS